jgi:two-component system, chemotaxis family, chemotaxis protein CheY
MRCLIAEDDFVTRNLLARMLLPWGTADIAATGIEAVAAFRKALTLGDAYRVVCLDIEMPGLDGHLALKAIREAELEARVPFAERSVILMVTAREDMRSVLDAFKSDCDGYLLKPVTVAKLRDLLTTSGRIPVPSGI